MPETIQEIAEQENKYTTPGAETQPDLLKARTLREHYEDYELDVARQVEEENSRNRGSYVGLVSESFMQESFLGGLVKKGIEELNTADMFIDPNFNLEEAVPNELLKRYPEELHTYLLESTSQEELDYRLEEADTVNEYQRSLNAWGLKGLPAIIIGSAVGDPSTYLTGGYSMATKGAKALSATQTLAAAAAASGLDLAAAKTVQPRMTWGDVTTGVAGSTALTAGLLSMGNLGKGVSRLAAAAQDISDDFHIKADKDTFKRMAIEQGRVQEPVTEAEEIWLDKWVDDVFDYHEDLNASRQLSAEIRKIDEQLAGTDDINDTAALQAMKEVATERLDKLNSGLAGKAQPEYVVGGEKQIKSITGTEGFSTDEAAFFKDSQRIARGLRKHVDKLSKTISGQVLNSDNDAALALMYRLGEYAPGWGGKYTRGKTAASWRELYDRQFMSLWAGDFHKAERLYMKSFGVNPLNVTGRATKQADFNLAVQRELNARRFDRDTSLMKKYHDEALSASEQAVKQAADAIARVRNDLLFKAKDAGVKRFVDAGWREYSTSRKWVPSNFYKVASDPNMGWNGVEEMLHMAILKALKSDLKGGLKDAPKEVSDRLSRAWAAAIVRRNKQSMRNAQGFTNDLFSIENREFIESLLSEAGLDETAKDTFIRAIDRKRAESTSNAVIEMDLNTSYNGHDIWELLDPNVPANLVREIKRTSGEIALAKVGIKSDKEFNDLLASTHKYGIARGLTKEAADKDIEYLDAARKLIMGETLEINPNSSSAKGMQLLRDVVQLGTLNWAGFAQFAETGKVAARLGVTGMMQAIPILRTLRRDMRSGKMVNTWLADLEEAGYGWIGSDHILNNPQYRIDANNFGVEATWDSQSAQRFTSLIKRLKHVQGFVNGMNAIKSMQDRVLTQGVARKVAGIIDSPSISPGQLKRLVDIGIDENMIPRIRRQMQAQNWREIKSFGLSNWTDQEAADTIMHAVQRAWMQDIQRSAVGEQYLWTQRSMGKLFAQFRTFTLGAIEKQSMHALKMRDLETFMTATWGMAFGTAAYLAKTYTQAVNKEDRDAFLEERLTDQAILSGGANLLGMSSILPELSHLVGSLTGQPEYDPFRYSMDRGTGITRRGSGMSLSNLAPSASYINRVYRVLQNTTRAAVDPEFNLSRRDLEDMIKAFPMGDNVWMGMLYSQALEEIPESNYE